MLEVDDVVLTGKMVRLEPLGESHIPGLVNAARDPSIWRYMLYGDLTVEANVIEWVHMLLQRRANRTDLPFAVILQENNQVVGATRFLDIRAEHRGVEIGGTWYHPSYQRTRVNTECKFLLLKYAFEDWNCIRVQFKADSRNEKSLRAIERLGATREGILRNHMILADGTYRHSVFFSILDSEWPKVKERLESLMENP